jgi:hypothetical protein
MAVALFHLLQAGRRRVLRKFALHDAALHAMPFMDPAHVRRWMDEEAERAGMPPPSAASAFDALDDLSPEEREEMEARNLRARQAILAAGRKKKRRG